MKKRLGFVSNSSSSSFLLGIALIKDGEKFDKWWETINLKRFPSSDVSITTVHDLKNGKMPFSGWGAMRLKGDIVEVECFRGDSVSLSLADCKPSDRVFIVDIANNEGDYDFYDYSYGVQYPDLNYDIDLEFLGDAQVNLYHGITSKENGFVDGQVIFGAARNG